RHETVAYAATRRYQGWPKRTASTPPFTVGAGASCRRSMSRTRAASAAALRFSCAPCRRRRTAMGRCCGRRRRGGARRGEERGAAVAGGIVMADWWNEADDPAPPSPPAAPECISDHSTDIENALSQAEIGGADANPLSGPLVRGIVSRSYWGNERTF